MYREKKVSQSVVCEWRESSLVLRWTFWQRLKCLLLLLQLPAAMMAMEAAAVGRRLHGGAGKSVLWEVAAG
jgi:hypothetical protein